MFVCLHSLSHATEGGRTIEACSSRADTVIYKEVDPAFGVNLAAEDTIKEAQTTSLVRFFNITRSGSKWLHELTKELSSYSFFRTPVQSCVSHTIPVLHSNMTALYAFSYLNYLNTLKLFSHCMLFFDSSVVLLDNTRSFSKHGMNELKTRL